MSIDLDLDECDRLILFYLYLVGKARLRDIVKTLMEKCGKLRTREGFYRRIKRRLIKLGLVEKKKAENKVSHYYLTEQGAKYVAKGVTSKNEVEMLIEKIASRHPVKIKRREYVEHVRFDMVIRKKNKNNYIKIVEGFTIPENNETFMETLRAIENSKEKWTHLTRLREHLEIIVNEKMHIANIVNLAQTHPNRQYTLIIIGTNPQEIPEETKNKISQIGMYLNELLDKALERIEKLQKQKRGNLEIIFTNNKTPKQIEK